MFVPTPNTSRPTHRTRSKSLHGCATVGNWSGHRGRHIPAAWLNDMPIHAVDQAELDRVYSTGW